MVHRSHCAAAVLAASIWTLPPLVTFAAEPAAIETGLTASSAAAEALRANPDLAAAYAAIDAARGRLLQAGLWPNPALALTSRSDFAFRNEGERFGMLDAQAWRAARLVVDTGLHALRWPRQRSIDFLGAAGLSETDAIIETDRYICWPGQALTYKIGQRVIERLRTELSARDGSAFDLRAFHDAVLGHGSLPLATLERELPNWLATPATGRT